MEWHRRLSLTRLLPMALALSACTGTPGAEEAVIERPLRRLSNDEYLDTVTDLFPSVNTQGESSLQFAPEVAIDGFTNHVEVQQVSPVLVEQYRRAAAFIAEEALRESGGDCLPDEFRPDCGRRLAAEHGRRVFRRPLTADEVEAFGAFFEAEAGTFDDKGAAELMLAAMLQSPQFLYRPEQPAVAPGAVVDPFELASRLSFFLWGSGPDEALLQAAESGALSTPEGLESEARRMLQDRRAERQAVRFHRQWLGIDNLDGVVKDTDIYPEWDDIEFAGSMSEEFDRFVRYTLFDGPGTWEALLTADWSVVNDIMARFYGVDALSDEWHLNQLPPGRRAGLLTSPAVLSQLAHSVHPSPVKRGIYVLDRFFCSPVLPPGANVDITPPEGRVDRPDELVDTNRNRYIEHLTEPSCAECHDAIDPVGFLFENYDAVGRWRDFDNDEPVDASGALLGTDVDGEVAGAWALGQRIARSAQARTCYVTQWFRFGFGRTETLEDLAWLERVQQAALATPPPGLTEADQLRRAESGLSVQALLLAFVTSPEFSGAPAVVEEAE